MDIYSRTRISDTKQATDRVGYIHTSVGGSVTSYTYGASSAAWKGDQRTIKDNLTPNWNRRSGSGEVIVNPCQFTRISRVPVISHFTLGPHPVWGSEENFGDYAAFFELGIPLPEIANWTNDLLSVRAIALAKAYARVDPNIVLGGENLKDLDKSVGMLKRPFGSSRDLLKKMEKYRFGRLGKTAVSAARATADAWLEYRYGWRPIVSDAVALMHSAEKIQQARTTRTLVARSSEKLERVASSNFTVAGGIPRLDSVSGVIRSSRKAAVSAGVIYTVNARSVAQTYRMVGGARLSDLPATVWEAVPFSFVVDWFTNVGDWLQAITPNPFVTYKGNWVTCIEDYEQKVLDVIGSCRIASAPVTTYTPSVGGSSRLQNYYTRYVNQSLSSTPTAKPTSLTRLQQVDAMSLSLGQILNKLKTFRH